MNRQILPARKEVALGFLSDNGSNLRPADILVYKWDSGPDVCMNITIVSPLTGGGVDSFVPGQAISTVVTRKRRKYLDKCEAQGFGFGTLAFTTLGELGDETIDFLQRLRNFMASHDFNVEVGNFLFYRIRVMVQRGVGAQLVSRMPTNFLKEPDFD